MNPKQVAIMNRLKKQATRAQATAAREGSRFLRWSDLDEGNWVLFSLAEGYPFLEEKESPTGQEWKFSVWRTACYMLVDDGGNVCRHVMLPEDAPEEDYCTIPAGKRTLAKHQEQIDNGMTVGFATAHEFVKDWPIKGTKQTVDFHKAQWAYFDDASEESELLWTPTKKTIP